jgi:hypothetical protein
MKVEVGENQSKLEIPAAKLRDMLYRGNILQSYANTVTYLCK